jgi:hypothetical protein
MGKAGPLLIPMLALPGLAVDLVAYVAGAGALRRSSLHGASVGAAAGAVTFLPMLVVEGIAGVELRVLLLHVLASTGAKAAFGAAGGAAGAYLARELDHHGLLGSSPETPTPLAEA